MRSTNFFGISSMASTRGKNAPGTYACWKATNAHFQGNRLYTGQVYPTTTAHPGLGLLASKMPSFTVAKNSTDLESALRGLGSSGLERPVHNPPAIVYSLPSQNIYSAQTVCLPDPLVVNADPRFTVFGGNAD